MILYTIIFVFIVVVLQAIWPILLGIIGLAIAGMIVAAVINTVSARFDAARQERTEIVARADRQHRKIMEGDWIAGTYGDYLPPEELR